MSRETLELSRFNSTIDQHNFVLSNSRLTRIFLWIAIVATLISAAIASVSAIAVAEINKYAKTITDQAIKTTRAVGRAEKILIATESAKIQFDTQIAALNREISTTTATLDHVRADIISAAQRSAVSYPF